MSALNAWIDVIQSAFIALLFWAVTDLEKRR